MGDSLTETYRDAFLLLMKQGRSPLEALREFDQRKIHNAIRGAFADDDYGAGEELIKLMALAGREKADEKDMGQAIELWLAGWTSELPAHYNTPEGKERAKNDPWSRCAVMSWYWRRPPKGKRTQGRLFLSTNQAFNAMKRERPE